MKNYKVIILLACYNGEKYIREQLDSIIAQTYSNWQLVIRDDGSIDNTLAIIQEYCAKNANIELLSDSLGNLRQCMNFSALIGYALDKYPGNIYMFSDQDDYWLSDKIEKEVAIVREDIPQLIYSNYNVTDNKLAIISTAYNQPISYSQEEYRSRIIMQNWLMGCTMMLNYKLLLLCYPIAIEAVNHDCYVGIIASFFGEIVYIHVTTILHRLHDANMTTREDTSTLGKQLKRTLKRINNRKKDLSARLELGNVIRRKIVDEKGDGIEKIDTYNNMLIERGARGVRTMQKNGFSLYTGIQNAIFKTQLILCGKVKNK